MVTQAFNLDSIFGALSDPTRRDILKRVGDVELSVTEIAQPYDLTLAAVSKHLRVLQDAKLVSKRRLGKQQLIKLSPMALKDGAEYLNWYRQFWEENFDSLAQYLSNHK